MARKSEAAVRRGDIGSGKLATTNAPDFKWHNVAESKIKASQTSVHRVISTKLRPCCVHPFTYRMKNDLTADGAELRILGRTSKHS